MTNESGFNWKYLIPGYGIYLINKSEMQGKRMYIELNILLSATFNPCTRS